jgi:hypothetical protein
VERELNAIAVRTLEAHFPADAGVSRERYAADLADAIAEEVRLAPAVDESQPSLATYLKLSVFAAALIRLHESYDAREAEIGERIYRTAEAYFALGPVKRAVRRALFFSAVNRRKIAEREAATMASESGVNGFKIRLVEGDGAGFGVDYLRCGICEYYREVGLAHYVKYLCLVDYAIMRGLGVSFSRTTTLGNGGSRCDFRFSKSGPVAEGWPPDGLPEWSGSGSGVAG